MVLLCEGKPLGSLINLARRHGIEASDNVTGQELSQMMQERWLRKTEHQYQIPGGPPCDEDMALLQNLNLVDAVPVPTGWYRAALVLGSTVVACRRRLAYLLDQYKTDPPHIGIFRVYLLGSARPLDPNKESPAVLITPGELPFKAGWAPPAEMPTTEADMMHLVFEQSDLPPWKEVLIDTPLQPTPEGKTRHPNTTDTVREFLKRIPEPGTYLVVSSQPFVARQTINVQQVLPEGFTVIGSGYAATPATPLKTFLDEVARLLYEELQAKQ